MNTIKIDPEQSRVFCDLVEYTKLPKELVLRRCQYATTELAILWHMRKGVVDFYQTNDLYLFDLTFYQMLLEKHEIVQKMVEQVKVLGCQRVLEFGGGIGEFSLVCAEQKLPVTYFDVEGVIKKYAQWRFTKHNLNGITVASHSEVELLGQGWDLINVMDVLEHLEQPQGIIELLAKSVKYIFCNPEEIKYNMFYPQHISRFDLTPYFVREEGYLWRNKSL